LRRVGIIEKRDVNQVANYALVEWQDNVAISDKAPHEYVPLLEGRFKKEDLEKMYRYHALPKG